MWWSALSLALREIRRNLMRSALTMLGIVIGVAAVITMVTIGNGTTAKVTAQIESLGSNLLIVRPGQRHRPGARESAKPFDLADAEALGRDIPSIAGVSASSAQSVMAVYGNANWSTNVTGIDAQYLTVRNWNLAAGRNFTSGELRAGAAACLLGESLRQQLFGQQDPIGTSIRLGSISCQVVGVLATKGQSAMGQDQDDIVLIPLRSFWRRIAGNQDVNSMFVSARAGASTDSVSDDIERVLRERRHISSGQEDDFSVIDMKEIAKTMTGTTQIMTALLGAVAAVSLIVGGIGIMNIMLVSVTERTREIGIRLAIGALEREVQRQFLVEAVVLSSVGGIVGIVLAVFASYLIAGALQVPFMPDGGIILEAFLFSAAVGVVFGYFPARKAAQLNPIDALRHE
ncbi:MAG: ABC transporter permease [Gammaproteobacteria bacterium]|nr:ABC transporter permease [Gammaproteobacteria bacterium]